MNAHDLHDKPLKYAFYYLHFIGEETEAKKEKQLT